jgi:hypothetical protein
MIRKSDVSHNSNLSEKPILGEMISVKPATVTSVRVGPLPRDGENRSKSLTSSIPSVILIHVTAVKNAMNAMPMPMQKTLAWIIHARGIMLTECGFDE